MYIGLWRLYLSVPNIKFIFSHWPINTVDKNLCTAADYSVVQLSHWITNLTRNCRAYQLINLNIYVYSLVYTCNGRHVYTTGMSQQVYANPPASLITSYVELFASAHGHTYTAPYPSVIATSHISRHHVVNLAMYLLPSLVFGCICVCVRVCVCVCVRVCLGVYRSIHKHTYIRLNATIMTVYRLGINISCCNSQFDCVNYFFTDF